MINPANAPKIRPWHLIRFTSRLLSAFKKVLPALLLSLIGLSSQSYGQIVFSGDFNANTGQMVFNQEITFTVTSNYLASYPNASLRIVFDELAGTSDGSPTQIDYTQGLLVSIDGTADRSWSMNFLDNLNSDYGDITSADSYLYLGHTAYDFHTGATITIRAQTLTQGTGELDSSFNSNVTGTFSGNVFLADSSGNRFTNIVVVSAVPEPSTYAAIFGICALGYVGYRRYRAKHAA